MAEEPTIVKRHEIQKGIDLSSGELRRLAGFSTDSLNADLNDEGDLIKRPGSKIIADPSGSAKNLAVWHGVGLAQESRSEVLLVYSGSTLRRLVIGQIKLNCSSSESKKFEIFYDDSTSQFRARLTNLLTSDVELDYALGTGTGSDPSIADLISQLDALDDVTASASTNVDTSLFAAHLEATTVTFADSGENAYIRAFDIEDVPSSGFSLPSTHESLLISTALVNDVLYFAGGGALAKYDGARRYRAGLPKPFIDGDNFENGAHTGATPNGTYRYRIQYVHVDNAGNVVQSQLSDPVEFVRAGDDTGIVLTLPCLTDDYSVGAAAGPGTSGFVTYDAGETITRTGLDETQLESLEIGERVMWNLSILIPRTYDPTVTVSAPYVQTGIITAKPSSTSVSIKTDFAGIISNKMPISQNLRILIWRTKEATLDPTLSNYYLIGEFPNEGWQNTAEYHDYSGDGSDEGFNAFEQLGDVPPDFGSPPPEGAFICNYRNHLVVAGVEDEPDKVHWSEPGRPDVFAPATNSARVSGELADRITGVGASEDYLIVAKDKSLYRFTGDLSGAFAVDRISSGLGCLSHHSIREISDGFLAFLSHKGPYVVARGQTIAPLGPTADGRRSRMAKFFKEIVRASPHKNGSSDTRSMIKTIAANWPHESKYMLSLTAPGTIGDNQDDLILVYDYEKDAFFFWDTDMPSGCIAVSTPSLTQDNSFPDIQGWLLFLDSDSNLRCLMPYDKRDEDYNDHGSAITFRHKTAWDHLGHPSVNKRYLRANVFSFGGHAFDLTVKQQKDWQNIDTSSISLSFTADGDPSEKGKFREQRARSQRLIFENSAINQRVTISGYDLEVVMPYKMKIKE